MTSTLDPVATARLVTREIRTGERAGAPTKIAVARRTYATERDDLWDALTSSERLPRWFLPVSGDLSVGGRYQLEGNAGGVVERCDAPESFAVTWEFGGQVSWLEIRLTEAGAGTTLELVHEALVDPEMWERFGPGAVGAGWDLGLMGLGLHLESRAAVDPKEAETWTLSPDGVEFVRLVTTGWAEAAVADGDDPAGAHEAAERTLDFYTTPPEA
ncbi:SRPBCC family protein [Isoptericola sp. BMS4]|uniref:SRPBCC family protein n=1 Tax=Isoptericola sp. BMS4 TaxID=2527875 RepID=UPI0014225BF1|nr:SRPBCC family protein [Isoptericola sp. BMS4]